MAAPLSLVTGAAGFLGRVLVRDLVAAGHRVRALVRRPEQAKVLASDGAEPILGDLADAGSLHAATAGAECVFHLAAALRGGVRAYDRVNRDGTLALATAARAAAPDLRRFVFVSSRAAVGSSPDGHPLSEATPPRPAGDYGAAKLAAERGLRGVPGLPFVVVRPPLLYGAGDRLSLPFFRLAARGLFPALVGGFAASDMVDVRDAARAVRLAAEAPAAQGRAVLLAGPAPVRPRDLAEALSAAAGRRLRVLRIPVPLLAAAADLLAPITGRSWVRELAGSRLDADPAEARRLLGFAARIPLRAGIAEAMAWYRREGWVRS